METEQISKEQVDAFLASEDAKDAEAIFAAKRWLEDNEYKYQPHVEKAIRYNLQKTAKYITEQSIPYLEEKYTELARANSPFIERKKIGDKIEAAYKVKENITNTLRNLEPLPLAEWITTYEIEVIERDGFLNAVGHPAIINRTYRVRPT